MNFIFNYMQNYDYENLFLCQDKALNFKAIIHHHGSHLAEQAGAGLRRLSARDVQP